jgi:hypothetical protein
MKHNLCLPAALMAGVMVAPLASGKWIPTN